MVFPLEKERQVWSEGKITREERRAEMLNTSPLANSGSGKMRSVEHIVSSRVPNLETVPIVIFFGWRVSEALTTRQGPGVLVGEGGIQCYT